jgi:hypothetical protein
MSRAQMPGRRFIPGRWNRDLSAAVPDIVPTAQIHRLPPCRPLPRLRQRPSERQVAGWCLAFAAGFISAAAIALLFAARH